MNNHAYNGLGQAEARECYDLWRDEQCATVKLFYDMSRDRHLTNDPEGCLVCLCALCADEHDDDILHASDDASGMACEMCGGKE